MRKMKMLDKQVQRMRNIIAILLALFVCTSICLGVPKYVSVNGVLLRIEVAEEDLSSSLSNSTIMKGLKREEEIIMGSLTQKEFSAEEDIAALEKEREKYAAALKFTLEETEKHEKGTDGNGGGGGSSSSSSSSSIPLQTADAAAVAGTSKASSPDSKLTDTDTTGVDGGGCGIDALKKEFGELRSVLRKNDKIIKDSNSNLLGRLGDLGESFKELKKKKEEEEKKKKEEEEKKKEKKKKKKEEEEKKKEKEKYEDLKKAEEEAEKAKEDAEKAKEDADKAKEDAEKAKEDAEKAREDAEKAREEADKAKENADKAKEDAEKAKEDAEKAREEAEKAKEDAEKANEEAEKSKEDAEKSKEDADKAKENADKAKEDADKAKEGADKAREDAEKAKEDADKAREEADKAKENADKAKEEAEKAKEDAEKAREEAEKAKEDADKAKEDAAKSKEESEKARREAEKSKEEVKKVKEDADKANEEAEKSKEESEKARREAEKAKEEVKKVKEESEKAKEDADKAKEDADKAKEDADKAKENADKAKEDADKAKEDADKAKEDADKAKENADKAKEDADKAKEDADKAKEDADKAKENADKAKEDVEKAKEDAEKAREEAEKAKEDADKAREDAEKAKEDADKAREDAEKAKEDADKAREDAEKAKEEAEKAREEAEKAKEDAEKSKEESERARAKAEKSKEEAKESDARKVTIYGGEGSGGGGGDGKDGRGGGGGGGKNEEQDRTTYPDIAGNGDRENNGQEPGGVDGPHIWNDPNGNRFLNINTKAVFGNASGAYMNAASVKARGLGFMSMIDNKIMVNDGNFNNHDIAGAWADDDIDGNMNVSLNTVRITGGSNIKDVYGGRIKNGTVSSNAVEITSVKIGEDVYGGYIRQNGTATGNKVNLTRVTVGSDVYGAKIIGDGSASSNTVTINGGKVKGNVFGGYVKGNGQAIHNTINITAAELSSPEFSPESILCGGICANATTNDAFTGNTLNIETKGVEVKGISNFEKYKFNLKDIKTGETILTATSGGYNEANKSACEMDLSRSNISLHTQGVLNKGDYYTLIRSQKRFKDNGAYKKFDFENEEILIKYYWELILTDDGQNLTAKLTDKKVRDEGIAKSLSEGYGAGIACINNGMDCILSKIEETESLLGEGAKLQGKGEIGVFCGVAANKSRYNIGKGSHIDMIGTSMLGGVGKVMEVREKELTVGVFAEHGNGDSEIICEKKSKGASSYEGVGVLGRCNICEDEFNGTKLYGEAILRAGRVGNSFNGKEAKDSKGKEYEYDDTPVMYGGCAVGVGGYKKHKESEKIALDWSLRYMFGYQDGRNVEKPVDADGNKVKFESVISNRIRLGVRWKYIELEKVKPYVGIGCECELSGKVKAVVQDGKDQVKIPAPSFGGVTGIGELGVSGKVWKFGVDISGQGYLGVRKGVGGMVKLKYAFGKDARGSLASSKSPRSEASTNPQPKDKEKDKAEICLEQLEHPDFVLSKEQSSKKQSSKELSSRKIISEKQSSKKQSSKKLSSKKLSSKELSSKERDYPKVISEPQLDEQPKTECSKRDIPIHEYKEQNYELYYELCSRALLQTLLPGSFVPELSSELCYELCSRALFPSSVPNFVPRNFVSGSFYLRKDRHNRLYSSRLSSIQENYI